MGWQKYHITVCQLDATDWTLDQAGDVMEICLLHKIKWSLNPSLPTPTLSLHMGKHIEFHRIARFTSANPVVQTSAWNYVIRGQPLEWIRRESMKEKSLRLANPKQ